MVSPLPLFAGNGIKYMLILLLASTSRAAIRRSCWSNPSRDLVCSRARTRSRDCAFCSHPSARDVPPIRPRSLSRRSRFSPFGRQPVPSATYESASSRLGRGGISRVDPNCPARQLPHRKSTACSSTRASLAVPYARRQPSSVPVPPNSWQHTVPMHPWPRFERLDVNRRQYVGR